MNALMLKYFVLKPRGMDWHAHASRMALVAYAQAIKGHEPELSQELLDWVAKETTDSYRI